MRSGLVAVVVSMVAACGFKGNEASDGGIGDDDAANPQALTVGFAAAASTTDESSATYAVPVLLSAPTDHPVTVNYEVLSGGTATQPTDYTLADGQIAIATGTTQANITVAITGAPHDDVAFTIALSAPQGASLGGNPQHTVTITAHALPTVSFNPATKSLSESNVSPSPQIALSAAATTPVTVTYRVVSPPSSAVAATSGTDFTLADGTVTISAGELSASLPLVVVNDTTDEFDEELDVSIISVLNAKPDTTNQLLAYTILDDDAPPTVSFAAPTLAIPEAAGNTTIPVSLSAASGKPITVPYTVALGTATAADIAIANGTLTFDPGTTTATIPVNVIQDLLDEDDETFTVTLDVTANPNVSAGANLVLAGSIADDDLPPTVAITTPDGMISEAGGVAALTVALSTASAKTVTVAFANTGSANKASDFNYVPSNQTLTFAPGALSATITIGAIDNAIDDMNRTVITTLVNPTNATIAGNPQTTTIVDDDPTCYGPAGAYRVCVSLPPTAPVALPATIDTDTSTLCGAQPIGWAMQGQPAVCLIAGTTVTMAGTTTVVGARPLIILASDTATINHTLDVAAHQSSGTSGPGAQATCTAGATLPGTSSNGGGGGAGGSFGSPGGGGGTADGGAQAGASVGPSGTASALSGGCPGTSGASSQGANAGTPGDGGGAVYLVAGSKLVLDNGTIDASGSGAGGGGKKAGGSGGGSGGMIRLFAPTISATSAVLFATGGGGASGGDQSLANGVAGSDPVAPGSAQASGGHATVGLGGDGGKGYGGTAQAQPGSGGGQHSGGGGGGGGGGMLISNQHLTNASFSAGFLDVP